MTLLLAYSAVLLLAVLVSAVAHRTVLSTAVLFLVAGFVLGEEVMEYSHSARRMRSSRRWPS
jgi:Kef-type K+ transport system membrane component KefB